VVVEFKQILCPVDLSESSVHSLAHAAALTRWYDARLTVLHVVPTFDPVRGNYLQAMIKERCTAGISIPAFSLWCVASFLFLIHAVMIGDGVFVAVQAVNLVAGGTIVGFGMEYKGEVWPFHRQVYGSQPR
jgi:hypothetical protein